jgi:hypothetical protein
VHRDFLALISAPLWRDLFQATRVPSAKFARCVVKAGLGAGRKGCLYKAPVRRVVLSSRHLR